MNINRMTIKINYPGILAFGFLVVFFCAKSFSMPDMLANGLIAFMGLLCFAYVLIKNRVPSWCLLTGIILSILMLMSILFNGNETEFFYAYKDGVMVAASIFFYNDNVMHYHLSGNYVEYRTYAPTNLLLYEAANWGRSKGIKALHLGGGVGVEDSLFHFKKQFNKEGRIGFYIGRNIFDDVKYKELLRLRKSIKPDFDMENTYYIQYRKP